MEIKIIVEYGKDKFGKVLQKHLDEGWKLRGHTGFMLNNKFCQMIVRDNAEKEKTCLDCVLNCDMDIERDMKPCKDFKSIVKLSNMRRLDNNCPDSISSVCFKIEKKRVSCKDCRKCGCPGFDLVDIECRDFKPNN